jgi:hypothetical protein
MTNRVYQAGADEERSAIIAKLRREMIKARDKRYVLDPQMMLSWLLRRAERSQQDKD